MAWTKAAQTKYSRLHSRRQNDLTGGEWEIIPPMIPGQGKTGRPRKTDMRRVFDAVRHMLSSGCRRRLTPSCYPGFSTVRNCFHAWSRGCVLERMPDALRDMARALAGRNPEPAAAVPKPE